MSQLPGSTFPCTAPGSACAATKWGEAVSLHGMESLCPAPGPKLPHTRWLTTRGGFPAHGPTSGGPGAWVVAAGVCSHGDSHSRGTWLQVRLRSTSVARERCPGSDASWGASRQACPPLAPDPHSVQQVAPLVISQWKTTVSSTPRARPAATTSDLPITNPTSARASPFFPGSGVNRGGLRAGCWWSTFCSGLRGVVPLVGQPATLWPRCGRRGQLCPRPHHGHSPQANSEHRAASEGAAPRTPCFLPSGFKE